MYWKNGLKQGGNVLNRKIAIPDYIVKDTVRGLTSFHPSPFTNNEGLLYWGGYELNNTVYVTTCVIPKAKSGPQEVHTTPEANAEVINYLNKQGLVLLAQVHSHPGDFKRHSPGDDKYAFMPYEGYFSIVVPYYSRKGMLPIVSCGFHVFTNGKFIGLSDTWTKQNVKIIPDYSDLRGDKHGQFFFSR